MKKTTETKVPSKACVFIVDTSARMESCRGHLNKLFDRLDVPEEFAVHIVTDNSASGGLKHKVDAFPKDDRSECRFRRSDFNHAFHLEESLRYTERLCRRMSDAHTFHGMDLRIVFVTDMVGVSQLEAVRAPLLLGLGASCMTSIRLDPFVIMTNADVRGLSLTLFPELGGQPVPTEDDPAVKEAAEFEEFMEGLFEAEGPLSGITVNGDLNVFMGIEPKDVISDEPVPFDSETKASPSAAQFIKVRLCESHGGETPGEVYDQIMDTNAGLPNPPHPGEALRLASRLSDGDTLVVVKQQGVSSAFPVYRYDLPGGRACILSTDYVVEVD